MRTIEQTFQQLTALISDQTRDLALAMAELHSVAAERDNARQSLRAAEADADETEGVNSDLRTVNARLVADLAAATQRADTAEAILRAKA
jgi:septal ring factor EnvC (AmiA/AmiB activator)